MNNPQTILITGASSGFGKAAAQLLASKGHKLILLARRQDRLEKLRQSLGTAVHTAGIDITNRQQVEQCFTSLPDECKDIDVVINNAGLALGLEPAPETNLDDWERMVDTNIKGLLYVTRFALDIMKRRNSGLVITIGSVAGGNPYKGGNVYGATKAFVRQFSRNLRTDLFGTPIKVTNIEPGMADTEFSLVRFGDQQKADAVYHGTTPLVADDIARTIAWVMDQPPHVNIENIEIMPLDQAYGGLAVHRAE